MVHRALSDKTFLLLGLLSPLTWNYSYFFRTIISAYTQVNCFSLFELYFGLSIITGFEMMSRVCERERKMADKQVDSFC